MDLEQGSQFVSLVIAVVSGCYAAVQAGLSWRERRLDLMRQANARRMAEVRALVAKMKDVAPTFAEVFDYTSTVDAHLRLAPLGFNADEVATRTRVDHAFEYFREIHQAVSLGLIARVDLGPWLYWIQRVRTRPPLAAYANACGYGAFMDDLIAWTEGSRELELLRTQCPWWTEPALGLPKTSANSRA